MPIVRLSVLLALALVIAGCTRGQPSASEAPEDGAGGGSGRRPDGGRGDAAAGQEGDVGDAGAAGPVDGPAADASAAVPDLAGGELDPSISALPDPMKQIQLTRALGLSYYHACFIKPDHKLVCFGVPGARTMPPPDAVDNVEGSHHGFCTFLGKDARPRFKCWGYNPAPFPPADLDVDPIQFGLGHVHGCSLNRDHSVTCWPARADTMPPAGLSAKQIAVAAFFNCAIQLDDSVVCWGINPPGPPPGLRAKLIAAAFHGSAHRDEAATQTRHACAIQLDDTVACWGDNVDGSTVVPAGLGKVKDLAVATFNSCALKPDGAPVCWGTRYYSPTPERLIPMPAGLHLRGLRAELATYCGIKLDNGVACWGDQQHDHITSQPATLRVYVPAD
jgi:hypothetical protein